MVLIFHIEYRTRWGEEMRVAGNIAPLGNFEPGKAFALTTVDGLHWTGRLSTTDIPVAGYVVYRYEIYEDGQPTRAEYDVLPRTVCPGGPYHAIFRLMDHWQDIPRDHVAYSTAFLDAIFARRHPSKHIKNLRHSVIIKVPAPQVDADHHLYLVGHSTALGEWNADRALPMNDVDYPVWQIELDADWVPDTFRYKFVLRHKDSGRTVAWEEGEDRSITVNPLDGTQVESVEPPRFDLPAWRGAGVAVPVFSLRTEGSWGIGDFGDLRRLIDWAAETHQRVVQILPINDTTMTHSWTDSYPYNSISIYALHPLYLDLRELPRPLDPAEAERLEQRRQQLNALPQIDYEGVDRLKWDYIRQAYKQERRKVLKSAAFHRFRETNEEWLKPYAFYSHLRDFLGTSDFRKWPCFNVYDEHELDVILQEKTEKRRAAMNFYYYVQLKLHQQLKAVSEYARERGVVLKGDIPIGISPCSVEAWAEPKYFHTDGQAGAPPDDFSVNGQNWGFPTYNWEAMERDGYAWWTKRFQKMAQYFSAYRIDHILGFFRIWEIPQHAVHGLLGQFSPALPMTRQEIESYGLPFREDLYLQPYICDSILNEIFGEKADKVRRTYLQSMPEPGRYRMLSTYNTQRKVQACFAQQTDPVALKVRDGLYRLLSNVLFLADHRDPGRYHPRISAMSDYAYKLILTPDEQAAFRRLYEDFYYHRHNDFWYQQAMKKLPRLVGSTRMLVCGEDLGMIPRCVPQVMDELRILSLEVQRMPKAYGQAFGNPAQYPYLSVSTISSHDTSTLRGWWEEDAGLSQRYYNEVLGLEGPAPAEASPALCERIISAHLRGPSMFCILALQDWMSLDADLRLPDAAAERINIPANPRHYWRYRMHLTLEQLMAADGLNAKIRELIGEAGRR